MKYIFKPGPYSQDYTILFVSLADNSNLISYIKNHMSDGNNKHTNKFVDELINCLFGCCINISTLFERVFLSEYDSIDVYLKKEWGIPESVIADMKKVLANKYLYLSFLTSGSSYNIAQLLCGDYKEEDAESLLEKIDRRMDEFYENC